MTTTKHFPGTIKQVGDAARRRIQFVASQEVVDGDGDVVLQSGIDRRRYELNPVLLAGHDRDFPIGKVTSMHIEMRAGGKATVCEAEILPAGTSARIDELWAAISLDVVRGVSVGFRALEADPTPLLPGQTGLTFRRVELFEISIVALPSCSTCLIEQKAHRPRQTAAVVCSQSPSLAISGDRAVPRLRLRDDDVVYRLVDTPTTYRVDPAMVRDTVRDVLVRAMCEVAEVAVQRALLAASGRVE